jgi:hypothetical protein
MPRRPAAKRIDHRMLRPGTFALTALLAALSAVAPLTTDMYLPSLPNIAQQLGASTAQVQLTISADFLRAAIRPAWPQAGIAWRRRPLLRGQPCMRAIDLG